MLRIHTKPQRVVRMPEIHSLYLNHRKNFKNPSSLSCNTDLKLDNKISNGVQINSSMKLKIQN